MFLTLSRFNWTKKNGLSLMEMIKSQHLSSACKPEEKKRKKKRNTVAVTSSDWMHQKKKKKKNVMINVENGSRVSDLTSAPWLNNLWLQKGDKQDDAAAPVVSWHSSNLIMTDRRSSWCDTSSHRETFPS